MAPKGRVRRKPGTALAVFKVDGKKANPSLMLELAESGWAGKSYGGSGHFLIPQKIPFDKRFKSSRGRNRSIIVNGATKDFALKGTGSSQSALLYKLGGESLVFPFGWVEPDLAETIRRKYPVKKDKGTVLEYGFIPMQSNRHFFRGGMLIDDARKNYDVARKLNALFEKSSSGRNADPVVKKAIELGASYPPTLEPAAVLRPKQAVFRFVRDKEPGPVFEEILEHLAPGERRAFLHEFNRKKPGETIVFKSQKLMKLSGIPSDVLKRQAVFAYSVPLELRVSDLHPLLAMETLSRGTRDHAFSAWKKLFAANGIDAKISKGQLVLRRQGKPVRYENALVRIMQTFSANLCNSIYLMHKLGGSYSVEQVKGHFGGSLVSNNVTADGRPLDLDTVEFHKDSKTREAVQNADIEIAQRTILELAAKFSGGKTREEFRETTKLIARIGYQTMEKILGIKTEI